MSTQEEVLRISYLARVRVTQEELGPLQIKFNALLEHFAKLSELDTSHVEPTYHAVAQMELREDVPEAPLSVEDLMKNAPEYREGNFLIPKVVGGAEQ